MFVVFRGEFSSCVQQLRLIVGYECEVENGCLCFSEYLVGIMEIDYNSLVV